MTLHLPIGSLKPRSVLEPVPRCEPNTFISPLVFDMATAPSGRYLWPGNGWAITMPHNGDWERESEMFYLTTHSTHFIYGYMASDIWLRTIMIVREETRCRHIGYSYRLTARVLLYAPSHRQDNTYHGLCYTSRGALAGTRNSSMGPPHEGSIRRPIAPWGNALPLSYISLRPVIDSFSCPFNCQQQPS